MQGERQVVLEISENAFKYNVEQIKRKIGDNVELIPVIKANAYGTFINQNIKLINDFKIVAVAIVKEAVELRNLGYKNEILVLNQPYIEEIELIIKNRITLGVSDVNFIKELGKYNEKVKIHLELETGMGRTGVFLDDLDSLLVQIKKRKNIVLDGVYTHFSSADIDYEYTGEQIRLFEIGVEKVKKQFCAISYVHASASNGIINFPIGCSNAVRAGIILYGYPSAKDTYKHIELKPVSKLKAKISFLKDVKSGVSIGYGRKFIARKDMVIATIGIGYADGIRRELSNKGYVWINGQRANIVGNICMDSFMVDVTNIKNVKVGDEVYIWDNKNITLEEVAALCNTINYEILCTISNRVTRQFVE